MLGYEQFEDGETMGAKAVKGDGKSYILEAVDVKHKDLMYDVYVKVETEGKLVSQYLVDMTSAGVDEMKRTGELPKDNGEALRNKAEELASELLLKGVYNKRIIVTSEGHPKIEDLDS